MNFVRFCAVVALLAQGCGDDAPPGNPDSGGGTDAGRTDSGTETDAGGDVDGGGDTDGGQPPGPCPANAPAEDSACTDDGLVCAFGDDPRPGCRPTATCSGGTWANTDPACDTPPPATCPDTREEAAGEECTPDGAYCSYDGLACHCTNCLDGPVIMCGGPFLWQCDGPNPDIDCPAAIPNLGTVCSMEAKFCSYGCEAGMSRSCEGGVWVADSAPGGCPISTRRVKTDIDYLSADERERVAEDLLAIRLATYEYTDPALRGRRHLGFILEDVGDSPAADPERSQVDLYGYLSMLVATVQTQERELGELRREVRDLRDSR